MGGGSWSPPLVMPVVGFRNADEHQQYIEAQLASWDAHVVESVSLGESGVMNRWVSDTGNAWVSVHNPGVEFPMGGTSVEVSDPAQAAQDYADVLLRKTRDSVRVIDAADVGMLPEHGLLLAVCPTSMSPAEAKGALFFRCPPPRMPS